MDEWQEKLTCALACQRCSKTLDPNDQRILSVYDHEPVCLPCKKEEEQRPDYEQVSREMIGTCMAETEMMYSDPGGYCFHHFYPFACKRL
ncbi:MAG: hypothetical protein HKP58_11405 [Desulfatitalea sp.]|nr:hypothetical protein [Desulfatitalea sp.]NNK01009.1 hypothetical protein [Desulfatitalea sp.]